MKSSKFGETLTIHITRSYSEIDLQKINFTITNIFWDNEKSKYVIAASIIITWYELDKDRIKI